MKTRTIDPYSIWNRFMCYYAGVSYWSMLDTDICKYTRWWLKAIAMCIWTLTWMTCVGIAGIILIMMFGCAFIDVLGLGVNFLNEITFGALIYSIMIGVTGVVMAMTVIIFTMAFIIIVLPDAVKSVVASVKDIAPEELPLPVEMYRSWKNKYCFRITVYKEESKTNYPTE